MKRIFGILFFAVGVGCAIGAFNARMHLSLDVFDYGDVWIDVMFGGMFLLGSYLLLRPN